MVSSSNQKVAIIGSGPAGLTAAIYTARAQLNPIIFAGTNPGGQLMLTTEVENYPGFADGIKGPELMQNMMKQAENLGAEIKYETIDKVDFQSKPFKLSAGKNDYDIDSVVIATGATPMKIGLESEEKFWGKGVSSCATCDGAFFKDKEVAVIGGGSVAFEDAIFLTRFAKKVYLIHRREGFKAEKVLVDRAKANEKIEFLLNYTLEEVLGDSIVAGIRIKSTKDGEEKEVDVSGVFVAIGYKPVTEFLKGQVEIDDHGYVVQKEKTMTSVDGVFVAGDVEDYTYRQAITSAGEGCKAAMDLEVWLAKQG